MGRALRLLLAVLVWILGSAPRGMADPARSVAPGAFSLAATLGQKSLDILSEGDIRPNARPFVFAGLEAQYRFSERWGVSWSGQLGGSFFDFNGPGVSGNVEETNWSTRVGLDWAHGFESGSVTYAGLGYEYGEARSWLKNLQVSETGPRNVLTGASVRAGAAIRSAPRLFIVGEVHAGAYRGRAEVGSLSTRYNWLGRSVGVSVGLRYAVRPGRADASRAVSGEPDSH